MTQVMQYEVWLFGPLRGATRRINGHDFIKGVCYMVGKPESMAFALKYLSQYQAYARGTSAFEAATIQERTNGVSDIHAETGDGKTDSVLDKVQPVGPGVAEAAPAERDGSASPEGRDAGSSADRNGHEDSGIPNFSEAENRVEPREPTVKLDPEIEAAVHKLNPDNSDHWTQAGLPKLSAVEEAMGTAGVTRKDVEASAPGWNRDQAVVAAVNEM